MATKVPENLIAIIDKYLEGTATSEEVEMVNSWYTSFYDGEVEVQADSQDMKKQIDARLRIRLKAISEIPNAREIELSPRRISIIPRIAAAAAIICVVSTALYFIFKPFDDPLLVTKNEAPRKYVESLENKITLTLQDGSKISLSDTDSGQVITQSGFTLTKTGTGQFTYALDNTSIEKSRSLLMNTIETPTGSQVQLTLPDGSRVKLNASSSFSFPVAFSANEFETKLIGEAYFEVIPNKVRKFKVRSAMQIVEVLGTRFNISAYRDEPSINTTLFEGSIRITDLNRNNSQLLKPGQRSAFNKEIQISDGGAEGAIAWAEGYFQFDNSDIKSVMRELERWYGIKVRYEGGMTSQKFEGAIDRSLKLEQVLAILEKSQVHFKMEGKVITIMP